MGTKEKKDSKLLAPWEAAAWGLGLGCLVGFFGSRAFQTECCPSPKYNVKVTTSNPCGSETVEHWAVDSTGVIAKGPPGLSLSSCSAGTNINLCWLLLSAAVLLFALSIVIGSRLIEKEQEAEEKEKVEVENESWKLIDTKEEED